MAQADITKSVQTLQNMINIVLVKTGNSIRSYRKESSTSQINAYTGNSFILPNAVENFHMALDDLETEILLCKATLSRDLDNLRSKHKVPENTSVQFSEQNVNFQELDGTLSTEKSSFTSVKAEIEATAMFKEVQDNSENHNLKLSDLGQTVLGDLSHQIIHSNSEPSIIENQTFQNANIHDQTKITINLEASTGNVANPDTIQSASLDSLLKGSLIENSIINSTGNLINLDTSFPDTTEQIPNYSQVQNPNFKVFGPGQSSQDYNNAMHFQSLGNQVTITGRFQDSNFPVNQIIGNGKNIVQLNPNGTHDVFGQEFYRQVPQNN